MRIKMIGNLSTILAVLCLALPVAAQEVPRFSGTIGAGFTTPIQGIGRRLDVGWNAGGGVGMNMMGGHLNTALDFMYNDMGINQTTLGNVGVPDGSLRMWGLTIDPSFHLHPKGFDAYIIGGGGVYHRNVEFTAPTTATVTVFDPFFGAFFPANVPANQVLASYEQTKPGWNIGAGFAVPVGKTRAKFFGEARYHHMFSNRLDTTILPVTFGVKW